MLNSVRARLTLWYVLVFGTLLIGFMVFVYALLSRSLYDRLDYSLANNGRAIVAEFLSEIHEQQGDARAGAIETLREVQLPAVQTAIFEGEQLLASSYPAGQQPLLPEVIFPN